MSKTSELDLCIGELRNAAHSLAVVADSLTALFSGGDDRPAENVAPTAPHSKTVAKPKPITLEQVRAVLAEKSRSGHTADVRALLESHGAAKLSEIEPTEYSALLGEAIQIGETTTLPDRSGENQEDGYAHG